VLVRFPLVLVTSTAFAPTTLAELIAYAKANPGKVNLAAQTNSPAHLTSLLFMKKAGVDVALVPYAAAAALTQSVLTNETHGTFGAWGPFRPHVAGGKVRAIAVAAPARLKDLPNVPTLKESGIDASWTVWYALFAPAGTPAPVVGKLAAASAEFVKVPTVIEQFNKLSMEVVSSTPAELARTIAEDTAARAEAARLGNVQPQ
jgi:tripartite-type tricarboxylate transporter receptor subunit TctC